MTAILVQALTRWSPFESLVWEDLTRPITKKEVQLAVSHGIFCAMPISKASRYLHVQRVAYLVVHGWRDAIDLDVGVPFMGCYVDWIIQDGNHRLAAAIFRNDLYIEALVGGQLSYAAELLGVSEDSLLGEEA